MLLSRDSRDWMFSVAILARCSAGPGKSLSLAISIGIFNVKTSSGCLGKFAGLGPAGGLLQFGEKAEVRSVVRLLFAV